MTNATRRAAIVTDLSNLSRNGWENAKPCDYQPLEKELAAIDSAPMFAHLTKVRDGYQLRITPSIRPIGGAVVLVPGKREARAICKAENAKPWNF